tara:strand:+ start:943 stop:2127 length:1185 start_codon:yes stop_codon:yes gene_type:complete
MLKSILNCTCTKNYSFELCNSITEVDIDAWNQLNTKNNIYLSTSYLTALETGMKHKMQFRYLTFFNKNKEAVGIAMFQIVSFQAKDLLQERIPCSIGDKIQSYFLNDKDLSLLICGNLYACGENGFSYTNSISREDFFEILLEAITAIKNTKIEGSKISFSLIKEFWAHSLERINIIEKASFFDFNVDVNMILKMRPEWRAFDLYLADMNTKYRTRAKAVFKKSKDIQQRSLSFDEIEARLVDIEILYKQVLNKADYNLGVLKVDTFIALKKELGDDFVFKGYFLEEKMIGFTSCFLYKGILDANFVGINYEYNNTYKLYQRMLYDFVSLAILHKKEEVRLGRTAETSKSGVGALPVEMKLFAKHRNLLPSKLLQPLILSIKPNKFELRKPFKN